MIRQDSKNYVQGFQSLKEGHQTKKFIGNTLSRSYKQFIDECERQASHIKSQPSMGQQKDAKGGKQAEPQISSELQQKLIEKKQIASLLADESSESEEEVQPTYDDRTTPGLELSFDRAMNNNKMSPHQSRMRNESP